MAHKSNLVGKIYQGLTWKEECNVYPDDMGKDDIEKTIRKLVKRRLENGEPVEVKKIADTFGLLDNINEVKDVHVRLMLNLELVQIDPKQEFYYEAIDDEIAKFNKTNAIRQKTNEVLKALLDALTFLPREKVSKEESEKILEETVKKYFDDEVTIYYEKTHSNAKGLNQLIEDLKYMQELAEKEIAYKRCEIFGEQDKPDLFVLSDYKGNNTYEVLSNPNKFKNVPMYVVYSISNDGTYINWLIAIDLKRKIVGFLRPEFHNYLLVDDNDTGIMCDAI